MGDPQVIQTAMFELEPVPAVPKLSTDAARTRRQAEAVAAGLHPLSFVDPRVKVHPDANGKAATKGNAADRPIRCGTCRWWTLVSGEHAGRFRKCLWGAKTRDDGVVLVGSAPRYSDGPATDVRGWWPGCTTWEKEPTDADV